MIFNTLLKSDLSYFNQDIQDRLAKFKRELEKTVFFNIDNIAGYYYSDSDQEYWNIEKDFPNIAPPFDNFWMEFKMPTFINSDGIIKTTPYLIRGLRFGAFFEAQEIPEEARPDDKLKWMMKAVLFTEKQGKILLPGQLLNTWGINKDGKLGLLGDKPFTLLAYNPEKIPYPSDEIREAGKFFYPMLLAISFLHCKNVKMKPVLPRPESAKRQRKSAIPTIKTYTLEIEPMRKILETEGNSQKTGLKLALHICRGHFKDFSKGTGLFGKYKGMFWWDSQVRGHKESGVIIKDYDIGKPTEA